MRLHCFWIELDFSMKSVFDKFSKNSYISDQECKRFTRLNKSQFDWLVKKLKTITNSINRNIRQALATYLFWLKSV